MIVYNNKGAFGGRVPAPCRKGGAGARVGGTGSRGSHSLPGGAAPPAERLVGQSWIPPKETLRLLLTMVCGLGGITPGPIKIKMARNKFLLIQLVYY